jgi:hypothetical protein
MTDQELICAWMEPRPIPSKNGWRSSPWWKRKLRGARDYAHPRELDLDALWEVEERLTNEQWEKYLHEFARTQGYWPLRTLLHATPEQKIRALAQVLRPIVEASNA